MYSNEAEWASTKDTQIIVIIKIQLMYRHIQEQICKELCCIKINNVTF